MVYVIALVLAAVSIEARKFNYPDLSDKPYLRPGAIKINGTYYVVASVNSDITNGVLPIHTSTDLVEWALAGYVFDGSNIPTWARNTTIHAPEIHQIGCNIVVYFSALDATTGTMVHIGVATAPYPLGPYSSIGRPIVATSYFHSFYPSIINDEEKLYLVWSNSSSSIIARRLNVNGLSFLSDQTTTLLKASLSWESGNVESPWYIQRGSYHYIFYGRACNGVGVARSANALGPYEKLPDPIIVPNTQYICPSEPSVVKDLDGENDVIFFNAIANGSWTIVLASLSWDSDEWPIVGEF